MVYVPVVLKQIEEPMEILVMAATVVVIWVVEERMVSFASTLMVQVSEGSTSNHLAQVTWI